MCSNDWCTFNVKVKRLDGHTEKERNQRAQSLLKRHEKTCARNHQAGIFLTQLRHLHRIYGYFIIVISINLLLTTCHNYKKENDSNER